MQQSNPVKKEKILVTGASGLIGNSVTEQLTNEYEVYTVGRHKPDLKVIKHFEIDFGSDWNVNILPEKMDIIIHLSQSDKFRDFPESAQEVYHVNTTSTLKLLEYSRKSGVSKFIYASSGGVYGNSNKDFTEETPINPSKEIGFYLGTKLCSEIIAENYAQFFDVIILRFFFVYGPRQKKHLLFGRLIDAIKSGKPITIQGEEGIKLNPIYVADARDAIKKSLSLSGSHKINIAGPEILSLKEIVNILAMNLGCTATFISNPGEAPNLVSDISKMKRLLIQPQHKLEETAQLICKK